MNKAHTLRTRVAAKSGLFAMFSESQPEKSPPSSGPYSGLRAISMATGTGSALRSVGKACCVQSEDKARMRIDEVNMFRQFLGTSCGS